VGRFAGTLRDAGASATIATPLLREGQPFALKDFAAVVFTAKGRGDFRFVVAPAAPATRGPYESETFSLASEWSTIELALDRFTLGGSSAAPAPIPDAIASVGFTISMPEPRAPSVTYNGMIHPLTPLRMRGVIWYQGEADTKRASRYPAQLAALIEGWREAWRANDLAFLVVQLPGYGSARSEPGDSDWAELREAQRAALALPRTALVTTIDLGDPVDIHPRNKAEVGRRLARAAERLVLGRSVAGSGPVLDHVSRRDGRIRLRFAETGGGITARGGPAVTGFALSADGRDYQWASARIADRETVEVWSDLVIDPVAVRYAWADDPACNLFNLDGLPASPFQASLEQSTEAQKIVPDGAAN
jgi:hypothetical protein